MPMPPDESHSMISDDASQEVTMESAEAIGLENSDSKSQEFVGRWLKLSSETNWEKGRIIAQWRASLIDSGVPSNQYSDEAWASRVGNVTCQHIGRLRRVFDRFGETYGEYPKIYWTHFWAAIDWDDAELWLEGASRGRWSISKMCRMRAESMQLANGQTIDSVVASEATRIESETDDGFSGQVDESKNGEDSQESSKERFESSPLDEGPDFCDEKIANVTEQAPEVSSKSQPDFSSESSATKNPFDGLGKLPLDIVESVDPLKLCILRYRANDWNGFSKSQMLDLIEALKDFCE
jgi:hypothetical protein